MLRVNGKIIMTGLCYSRGLGQACLCSLLKAESLGLLKDISLSPESKAQ